MIKKITTFILLSSLVFMPFIVKAEIEQDSITIVVDITNIDDRAKLYNLIERYNLEVDEQLFIYSISVYGGHAGPPLVTDSNIALNGDPYIINYGEWGYSISSNNNDYIEDMDENVENWAVFNVGPDRVLYYVITLPPPPTTDVDTPQPLFKDTTLSITLLILFVLSLGMYLIFKSNLILLPTIILWLGFIINTNNGLIVLFATLLFIITITITFFKDKKGDNW